MYTIGQRTMPDAADHSTPLTAADSHPTASGVVLWARQQGIRLALTDSKDGIAAGPKHLLSGDFRQAIKAVNPYLIRHLLVKEALAHYAHRVRQTGDLLDSPRAAAGYSAMAEGSDRLDDIWEEADLEEFRDELRNWLKAGLAAHRDAGKERWGLDRDGYEEATGDGSRTDTDEASADLPQEDLPQEEARRGQFSLLNAG